MPSDAPGQIVKLWEACDRKPVGRGAVRLTEELVHEFAEQIRRGNFMFVAASRLGFTKSQIYNWRNRGAKEIEQLEQGKIETVTLCAVFTAEADRASGDLHDRLIVDVLSCDDPKVKLEFLKRRWAKIYSANPNASEDPDTGETSDIDVAGMIAEKLAALRDV